jgi:hypothetical protein
MLFPFGFFTNEGKFGSIRGRLQRWTGRKPRAKYPAANSRCATTRLLASYQLLSFSAIVLRSRDDY